MARLRYNGLTTELGAELGAADTTVTFASALAHAAGSVPTISGSDYIPLAILGADGDAAEIVHLTAYTSGATTGTITRAQESTTAAVRASGSVVKNAPTAADFPASPTVHRDTLPSDFTTTVNATYTTISGLTFSLTPSVDGTLLINSRLRAMSTSTLALYFRAVISPAPIAGPSDIGAANETATANKRFTYQLVGGWGLDGGTTYTVTVEVYQAGAGTVTVEAAAGETELLGIFMPT